MSVATISREEISAEAQRWTLPHARSLAAVNEIVSAPLLERGMWSWRAWWIGVAVSFVGTVGFLLAIFFVFDRGIGIWGVNTTVVCPIFCRHRAVKRGEARRIGEIRE